MKTYLYVLCGIAAILLTSGIASAAPVIYPAPTGAPLGTKYSLTVNGTTVAVYDARIVSEQTNDPRNCYYAYFDLPANETAQLVVTVPAGFTSAKVRPVSANIVTSVTTNTIGCGYFA